MPEILRRADCSGEIVTDKGYMQNKGKDMSTEGILRGFEKLEAREEIKELKALLLQENGSESLADKG